MDSLPSFRRMPWLPGTFLVTLAAMIDVIFLATDRLRTTFVVAAVIILGLGGGALLYWRTIKQRRQWSGLADNPPYGPAGNPYDPNDPTLSMPAIRQVGQPIRWLHLRALARAAPLLGVGLAFCFNYKVASQLFSAQPAADLRSLISVTLLALGFAVGLATRPYALRPSRPAWLVWTALVIIIVEWITLFMLFTATFNGSYRSVIAPAVVALGAVVPLLSIARELMDRRYSAQLAGLTIATSKARPNRLRALWRSGGGRFAIGALGLLALVAYMFIFAPHLNGPSLVVRMWPLILALVCIFIPRGSADGSASTLG